jgi:hypothetical protein
MPADPTAPADCVSRVAVDLAAEFAGLLPLDTVTAEVATAERDLRGQVVPAALAEMLHRLADHRLQERVSAGEVR